MLPLRTLRLRGCRENAPVTSSLASAQRFRRDAPVLYRALSGSSNVGASPRRVHPNDPRQPVQHPSTRVNQSTPLILPKLRSSSALVSRRKDRPPYPLLLPTWLVLGIFFLVPLALMLAVSFRQRGAYGGLKPIEDLGRLHRLRGLPRQLRPLPRRDLSRHRLALALDGAADHRALPRSSAIPWPTTSPCVAPRRWKSLLLGLVVVPFWTSFLIRTYAWMFILRTEGLVNRAPAGAGLVDRAAGAPLHRLRGDDRPGLRRAAVHDPAALRLAGKARPRRCSKPATDLGAGRGLDLLPRDGPADHARHRRRASSWSSSPASASSWSRTSSAAPAACCSGNLIQNQFAVARNKPFGAALAFELTAAVLLLLFAYALYTEEGQACGAGRATRRCDGRAASARRPPAPPAHGRSVYLFLYVPIVVARPSSPSTRGAADRGLARASPSTGTAGSWPTTLILRAVSNSLIVAALTTVARHGHRHPGGPRPSGGPRSSSGRARGATQAAALPADRHSRDRPRRGAAHLLRVLGSACRSPRWSSPTSSSASPTWRSWCGRASPASTRRSRRPRATSAPARGDTFRGSPCRSSCPGSSASALLVFTLSIDDYVVTSFVAGVGATTLPLQIYSMLQVGVTPEVNAVSTLLLAGTIGRPDRGRAAAAARLLPPGTERSRMKPWFISDRRRCSRHWPVGRMRHEEPAANRRDGRRGTLNIYIWTTYLPQEVIDEFAKKTGIEISVDTYDSNEALLAKLQSGVADYDLVVPSDYMVRILIAAEADPARSTTPSSRTSPTSTRASSTQPFDPATALRPLPLGHDRPRLRQDRSCGADRQLGGAVRPEHKPAAS